MARAASLSLGGLGATLRDRHARHHIGAMHLDLSDEEAAALTQELHDIVENDRYPFSSHPHAEGHSRQAQTGAGAQALAPM
jgi:hypothetical protein